MRTAPCRRTNAIAAACAALAACAACAAFAIPRAAAAQAVAGAAAQVTVYRCVDATGRVSLRDTPCAKGERQEARDMIRPKDAPPAVPARRSSHDDGTDAAAASPAPAPAPRIVIVREPATAPMYECTTPDNTTYTSDSPEGNPRWVPMWTLGWPVRAGTWVRDACRPMPQAETCARLRDGRDELERRFFNAMPSERARLEREERALDARLDADCGGR